jgi:hypothetical protein
MNLILDRKEKIHESQNHFLHRCLCPHPFFLRSRPDGANRRAECVIENIWQDGGVV